MIKIAKGGRRLGHWMVFPSMENLYVLLLNDGKSFEPYEARRL